MKSRQVYYGRGFGKFKEEFENEYFYCLSISNRSYSSNPDMYGFKTYEELEVFLKELDESKDINSTSN